MLNSLSFTAVVLTLLMFRHFRTYSSFTMETILATAFGRVINVQRGESDELTKAVDSVFRRLQEGSSMLDVDMMILLISK